MRARRFGETFLKRRDHLLSLIEGELGMRAVVPDGAFYTMLDVSEFGPSMRVAEALLGERVITVPGAAFGSECEGFLRVSFCADIDSLTEGVKRIKNGLLSLSSVAALVARSDETPILMLGAQASSPASFGTVDFKVTSRRGRLRSQH